MAWVTTRAPKLHFRSTDTLVEAQCVCFRHVSLVRVASACRFDNTTVQIVHEGSCVCVDFVDDGRRLIVEKTEVLYVTNVSVMARCALVTGNLVLFFATLACGIAFFGPYWLANVRPDEMGSGDGNATYFLYPFKPQLPDETYVRGLWAECGRRCQWFWQKNSALQRDLFTPLREYLLRLIGHTFSSAAAACIQWSL